MALPDSTLRHESQMGCKPDGWRVIGGDTYSYPPHVPLDEGNPERFGQKGAGQPPPPFRCRNGHFHAGFRVIVVIHSYSRNFQVLFKDQATGGFPMAQPSIQARNSPFQPSGSLIPKDAPAYSAPPSLITQSKDRTWTWEPVVAICI